jgi:hypothetical protein
VFRLAGLYSLIPKNSPSLQGDVEMYYSFDHIRQRISFDRRLPARPLPGGNTSEMPGQPNSSAKRSKKTIDNTRRTRVILTPGETLMLRGGGAVLKFPAGSRKVFGLPFDVRAMGLYSWDTFHNYTGFDEVYSILRAHKPREIQREDNGRWRILWEFVTPMPSLASIWVDEAQAFSIIRSEHRYPVPGHSGGTKVHWDVPAVINMVSWFRRSDLWLPKTLKLQESFADRIESYDLAFEWKSTNEDIPESLFSINALGGNRAKRVIDMATGKPISEPSSYDDLPSELSLHGKGAAIYWLMGVNAVILTGLAVTYVVRYRRRRGPHTNAK